jgi:Flp pilus assembly protein TadD
LASIVLVVTLTSALIASQEATVIEQAQQDLASGNFEQAVAKLSGEAAHHPESPKIRALLAFAEWRSGRLEDAVRDFDAAIGLDPNSFSAHYNLGLLYLQQKEPTSALPHLERAAQLEPENPDVQYNCALVLIDVKRGKEALNHLLVLKQLQPQRPDVRFQIVRAKLAINRLTEAKAEATSFATDYPDGAGAVGQAFLEFGQPGLAITYLEKAIRAHPEDENVRCVLAETLIADKRSTEALTIIGEPRSAFGHALKAQAFYDSGHLTDALRESQTAVALEPSNAQYLLLAGRLLQLNNDAGANHYFERAIATDPKWPEPYYNLAVSSYLQQNYPAAIARLEEAISLNPQCARCLFLRGLSYFNRGESVPAKSDLERAVVLEPKSARFRTHLSVVFFQSGQLAAAESGFRMAISLDPNYGLPYYQLGKLLARTPSRLDEAARELEEAHRLDPNLAQALYQLGLIYEKLGKQSEATRALNEFRKQKAGEEDEQVLRNDLTPSLVRWSHLDPPTR